MGTIDEWVGMHVNNHSRELLSTQSTVHAPGHSRKATALRSAFPLGAPQLQLNA